MSGGGARPGLEILPLPSSPLLPSSPVRLPTRLPGVGWVQVHICLDIRVGWRVMRKQVHILTLVPFRAWSWYVCVEDYGYSSFGNQQQHVLSRVWKHVQAAATAHFTAMQTSL